ncbi:aldose epimerase family protein [Peribacillus kribbensis]|uniref:aldose epimerase family protein n=1 Tax=Peribacillus kribbensis TaxID=356658 RepID=UPI00041EA90B|nr:aldose epimerase family protein [Peribacillus kribbensis]
MKVEKQQFGELKGRVIESFTLKNHNGMEVTCINLGCIITRIMVPDRNGNVENVVLGYETLNEYVNDASFFGAVVGRVAGRISKGRFELDGKEYTLAKNENGNHLHGGMEGFNQKVWDAEVVEDENTAGVAFTYTSPDGEEGYPGTVKLRVTYLLNDQNQLIIHYTGISDQRTPLNVTNHSYFNLTGNIKSDILNHRLKLKSHQFLELDEEMIPTGKMLEVEGTEFDFRDERAIKTGVGSLHPQNVLVGGGYDHPFILDANNDHEIVLSDPESGRTLIIETDEAGVVVYSGNQLITDVEKDTRSKKHLGICLETQGLPDAVNHSHFPSWILEKDTEYVSKTTYKFGVSE